MIIENHVLNVTADKKEQERAINNTQNPMARGEVDKIIEIDREISKEDEISNIIC